MDDSQSKSVKRSVNTNCQSVPARDQSRVPMRHDARSSTSTVTGR